MIFEYLTRAFIQDYMSRRFSRDDSGWRSLGEVAKETGIPRSIVYSRSSKPAKSSLQELFQRGFVERRFFRGVRGRGGEVMKLRVAFENDLIKDYVEERIRGVSLRKNAANITDRTLVNSSPIVRTPVAQLDKLRIAVLPFLNISRDPSDEYFTNGMTEEMISSLSKLGGLKVIARTSVLPFRDEQKRKNIEEIAQELRVGTIVDGSVRTDGDKLRISIQLIDCENGESLWSESFDRNLKDVLSIQAEVSSSVVEALKVHLPIQPRKKTEHLSTKNPLAYEMYLKGRYCMRSFYSTGEADFRRSIEYLQHAVKLDPSYAEAYAWLSTAYSILAYNA